MKTQDRMSERLEISMEAFIQPTIPEMEDYEWTIIFSQIEDYKALTSSTLNLISEKECQEIAELLENLNHIHGLYTQFNTIYEKLNHIRTIKNFIVYSKDNKRNKENINIIAEWWRAIDAYNKGLTTMISNLVIRTDEPRFVRIHLSYQPLNSELVSIIDSPEIILIKNGYIYKSDNDEIELMKNLNNKSELVGNIIGKGYTFLKAIALNFDGLYNDITNKNPNIINYIK